VGLLVLAVKRRGGRILFLPNRTQERVAGADSSVWLGLQARRRGMRLFAIFFQALSQCTANATQFTAASELDETSPPRWASVAGHRSRNRSPRQLPVSCANMSTTVVIQQYSIAPTRADHAQKQHRHPGLCRSIGCGLHA
jgi:hypothetical protein